jgi:chemotaxis protein histidine kinase CheA
MTEPALDLSEIMELYKEDARRMTSLLRDSCARWEEIRQGGIARTVIRRLSHQLRGSGRTYGFREVTRLSKAVEAIVVKLERKNLPPDERVHEALRTKIDRLVEIFKVTPQGTL